MSGGRWEYVQSRIADDLRTVAEDEIVKKRWPMLGQIFENIGEALYQVIPKMDWDISGDTALDMDDDSFSSFAAGIIAGAVFQPVAGYETVVGNLAQNLDKVIGERNRAMVKNRLLTKEVADLKAELEEKNSKIEKPPA